MNSRILLNIALFAFLASTLFFFMQKNNNPENIQRLSSLSLNEIKTIRIPREDNLDILFVKNKNGIWDMTQPYQIKAHQFRINTLLKLTQTPVNKKHPIEKLNLVDYALAPPRARIIFNTTEIAFGKTNPVNSKRYLLAENKMLMFLDQTYPLVSAQAASFIDLSLMPDNFDLLKIRTPETSIQLQSDNKWESTGKITLNADQIQTLIQNWKSTQAFATHKYLPRKNLGELEISSKTKTLIFKITDEDPWLILALPEIGIEYHLDKSSKNSLFGSPLKDAADA